MQGPASSTPSHSGSGPSNCSSAHFVCTVDPVSSPSSFLASTSEMLASSSNSTCGVCVCVSVCVRVHVCPMLLCWRGLQEGCACSRSCMLSCAAQHASLHHYAWRQALMPGGAGGDTRTGSWRTTAAHQGQVVEGDKGADEGGAAVDAEVALRCVRWAGGRRSAVCGLPHTDAMSKQAPQLMQKSPCGAFGGQGGGAQPCVGCLIRTP